MVLTFYKYQGTGNDFIMVDNRNNQFPKNNTPLINNLCDRYFGIGADGVILIEGDTNSDFKMHYYNADGSETFCGNGARCAVAFAKRLNLIKSMANFTAFDGQHFAEIIDNQISLQMKDVTEISVHENTIFTNTGTQHHVQLVHQLDNYPVVENGKKIRYSYPAPGANVNFVQKLNNNTFRVRTYEKGVENETLACGTGVTAVAIAMHYTGATNSTKLKLPVEGGELEVSFSEKNKQYTNVFLKGPAQMVYEGKIAMK